MFFEPFGPVKEVSVKRACLAFDLDVALDGCRAMPSESLPLCVFSWRSEGPGVPLHCSPIALSHPFGAFVGVFSGHLLPEHAHQKMVAHRELLLGNDRAIIQRPAVDHWVQLADELFLSECLTLLKDLLQRLQMALNSFFTGRNQRFKAKRLTLARRSGMGSSHRKLSNGEPQEVEPHISLIFLQGMGEPGFAWFQF